MRDFNVKAVAVPNSNITIDNNEAAVRLKVPRNYTDSTVTKCRERLLSVIKYKYAYVEIPVELKENRICVLGDFSVESRDLCRVLTDCNTAYIMGATIGIEVDRLITRLHITSPSEAFITDGLASAAAESLAEYADTALRGNEKKPMRFSPGYGDLPLDIQPDILKMLNAEYTLGIKLNKSLLMTPLKSVTAVMGILKE